MKNSCDKEKNAEQHRRSEERLRDATAKGASALTEVDTQRLMHELRVHQVELEAQNQELRSSRAEAEAGLERYTDLYDFAPVGYLAFGRDGRIRQVNLTGARLMGMERTHLLGRRLELFIRATDRPVFNAFLEKVFAGPAQAVCEVALLSEGREPLDVHLEATAAKDAQECRLMMVDITERRQAEEALRALSRRMEAIVAAVPEIIMEVDCNRVYTWANPAGIEFFGEEVIGKDAAFYFEGEQATYENVQPLFNGDEDVFYVESWQRRRDGHKRLLSWWCRVLKDAEGKVTGALSSARDITDQRRAEESLRESKQIIEGILNAIPARVFWKDKNLKYLGCNTVFARDAGFSDPKDIIGKDDFQLGWRDQAESYCADDRRVIESGCPKLLIEEPQTTPAGKTITLLTSKVPLRNSKGEIDGVLGSYMDVTEQKLAEGAVQREREILRSILEDTLSGYWDWDLRTNEEYLSPTFKRMFGYEDHELPNLAETWQKLIFTEDLPGVMEVFSKHAASHGRFPFYNEVRYRHKTGATVWVLCAGRIIEWDEQGQPQRMVGCHIDITERKRAENDIRENEEKNRKLIEALTDAVIVRSSGVITYANPAAIKLFRTSRMDELIGKRYLDLVHPDDRAESVKRVRKSTEENWVAPPREHRLIALNGQVVEVESTGLPVQFRGKTQEFGVFRDITERNKASHEKEKLEAQLRQLQKMEAIGTLAGGIAHDFNNILSVIIGNSELLTMEDETPPSLKRGLDQIYTASQRAKQLVNQILTFSRQGQQPKLLINLKAVVKETIGFLRSSLPSTIQLQHYIKPDSAAIMADPTQMQQILMNLCTNAAHAMEELGGVLKIDLDNAVVTEEEGRLNPGIEPGNYVRLTVSDTGHGMEPGVQTRVFDPYFTTKEPGKGTGLGLSVVHGIVKSHGGMITVDSAVGKGTTFKVFLPRAEGVEAAEPKAAHVLPKGTETILLVDDKAALADLGKQLLSLLGYQVETRTSSIEALELFRHNPERFDLVLTDMTMPQMTGMNLAREMLAIRPGIPIILCTGFSDQATEAKARSAGIRAFLFKPLVIADLAKELRRVLDEK